MEKRFWAIWVKQFVMGMIVIFGTGMLYDYFTAESDAHSPFKAGALAIVFYLVAALVFGTLNLITSALYLWLFAEKDFSGAVLDDLRSIKLPAPGTEHPKNHQYLAALADDENAAMADRVRAAMLYGTYKGSMSSGLFKALIFQKAIDTAVLLYAQETPQRSY